MARVSTLPVRNESDMEHDLLFVDYTSVFQNAVFTVFIGYGHHSWNDRKCVIPISLFDFMLHNGTASRDVGTFACSRQYR